ncbi:Anti-sigma regulatory factor (Ser/Thr protein kinase) [Granulicella pectinivorans]|uniref:Anti-sigma regulatory factor (Ser/Thr protein kinase) n=1 Tax=Granulicella pectinivorans TaxID=474950 RepID=A0A1I6LT09_9BACT|nr:SpoIIE family protein phosphatase [Granulicella pectinivorans]SFS06627.1 Anti-sigma regulatory factor (Ser/Thr protein kinase) [Granulicella pectinivorans]
MEPIEHTGANPQPIRTAVVIPIEDSSQIPVARRAVLEAGRELRLDEATLSRAEIVAVELARNIFLHGRTVTSQGGVPLRRIQRPGELFISSDIEGTAVQIVAVDSGVGISSILRAMTDGFSTSGTPGLGLGAVKRLSRSFDIFSSIEPDAARGTVVAALVGPEKPVGTTTAAVLSSALPGETVGGDSWASFQTAESTYYLMADGLGHGPHAHDASTLAVNLFLRSMERSRAALSPAELLTHMHPLMRATRGAAIALIRIDHATRQIVFCGVGNISMVLSAPNGATRTMLSHNGTLGHQMQRVQEFTENYLPGSLLILHSDGIHTSWKLQNATGLDRQASATIAGAIYREAWRGRDDATVLVARLA